MLLTSYYLQMVNIFYLHNSAVDTLIECGDLYISTSSFLNF